MEDDGLGFVGAGWLRVFPAPALWAYTYVARLAWGKEGPIPGDLDDLGPQALRADKYEGLDTPLGEAAITEGEDDEDSTWRMKWTEWQGYATALGRPMETYRHVIEFMAEIGLLERHTEDGAVWWRPTTPCPLAEDALPLSDEEKRVQSRLRWQDAFRHAESRILNWLVDQRGDALDLRVETSLARLAESLDLDLDDTRHGLACVVEGAVDISANPEPESVGVDDLLLIVVDWQRFDEDRISIQLVTPEE